MNYQYNIEENILFTKKTKYDELKQQLAIIESCTNKFETAPYIQDIETIQNEMSSTIKQIQIQNLKLKIISNELKNTSYKYSYITCEELEKDI